MIILACLAIFTISVFAILFTLEQLAKSREENVKDNGRRRYFILREFATGWKRTIRTNKEYPLYTCVQGTIMENGQIPFEIDGMGFIEPSKIYEDADINIAFVGDSTTECALVAPELRYPYLVGRMLQQAKGMTVNSYNAGYSGASSVFILATVLYKILPLKPQAIIWQSNISDIIPLLNGNDWGDVVNGKWEELFWTAYDLSGNLLKRFKYVIRMLFPNLYEIIGSKHNGKETSNVKMQEVSLRELSAKEKDRVREQILSNLKIFVEICRSNFITPVVTTQAILWSGGVPDERESLIYKYQIEWRVRIAFEEFYLLFEDVNCAIREFCKKETVVLVDLESEIPKEEKYIYDYVHYTNEGSQKAAECINTVLQTLKLKI